VVLKGAVPAGAIDNLEKFVRLYPVTAGMLGPLRDEGEKSRSHLKP
jgi:hypothetical protein